MNKAKWNFAVIATSMVLSIVLSGCSTNDNPVSQQKMQEIRKNEARDRQPSGDGQAPGVPSETKK